MSLLPPVGWADVATKHDLDALGRELDLRFEALDTKSEARLDAVEQRLRGELHLAMSRQLRAITYIVATLTTLNLTAYTLLR